MTTMTWKKLVEEERERLRKVDPMTKSNYGYKPKPKTMSGTIRDRERSKVVKGTTEYLASGKTVTKVKTIGTPAWLTRRKKVNVIISTKDLLKGDK